MASNLYYSTEVYSKAAEMAGIQDNQIKYILSLIDGAKELLDEKSFKYLPVDPQSLINDICRVNNITYEDLIKPGKLRILADARAVSAVIISEVFHDIQLKEIGWLLRRSPSQIVYYLVENKRCSGKQKMYQSIRQKLNL